MREIKFRTYGVPRGRRQPIMARVGLMETNKDGFPYEYQTFWTDGGIMNGIGGEPAVLMQYTGLKDKNGKEIYEGDIVKFQLIARPAETYVVEWGHFGFTYKKSGDDGDHYLQQAYLEVIGNIYENKDLL